MTPVTSTYQHNNTAPTGIPPRQRDSAETGADSPVGATLSRPAFLAGQTPNMHPNDHIQDDIQAFRPLGERQHIAKGNSTGILVIRPP